MKNTLALCLLGLVSLGTATMVQAAKESSSTEVAALEKQWTLAQRNNTPDLIPPLLADGFMQIDPDGSITNREQAIAEAKGLKFASLEIDELHITVTGGTAVATMVYKAKGTDEKGKPMDINARWADTWVKMPNGAWQCVLSQGSSLK